MTQCQAMNPRTRTKDAAQCPNNAKSAFPAELCSDNAILCPSCAEKLTRAVFDALPLVGGSAVWKVNGVFKIFTPPTPFPRDPAIFPRFSTAEFHSAHTPVIRAERYRVSDDKWFVDVFWVDAAQEYRVTAGTFDHDAEYEYDGVTYYDLTHLETWEFIRACQEAALLVLLLTANREKQT